jgi:ribosomal-protein-alanine N-acetyltransferase
VVELVTPRLRLRRARADDLEAMHAVLGSHAATRYWSRPAFESVEQTRAWLASMIDASAAVSFDFVVEYQGRVIGKAGCHRLPEIGFIFHPDYWGQGLAREALDAVIARVFAASDVRDIEADVDPRNAAALGLLSRLGFREVRRAERTWKVGDAWCDSVYLALSRPTGCAEGAP